MENNGATIWARKTIDSDIFFWKPDKWFKIWFFIINKVNHKDTKLFPRGQNLITYREISEKTKATKHQIDQFIRWSKKEAMLTTRKTTRGMVVTVLKYDKYQVLNNYKNDTENELQTKHKRNTNDTINKNVKNDKNEKKREATPSDKTNNFFNSQKEQQSLIRELEEKGFDNAESEVRKFISYWTELNKSGTKQRWELQQTFEINRRMGTWFRNNKGFGGETSKGRGLA